MDFKTFIFVSICIHMYVYINIGEACRHFVKDFKKILHLFSPPISPPLFEFLFTPLYINLYNLMRAIHQEWVSEVINRPKERGTKLFIEVLHSDMLQFCHNFWIWIMKVHVVLMRGISLNELIPHHAPTWSLGLSHLQRCFASAGKKNYAL